MELTALALFVMFSLTTTVMPGPNVILTMKSGLTGGRTASDLVIVGISMGGMLWGALAVGGIAVVMERAPALFFALKLLGAGYIFWLGLGLWRETAARRPASAQPEHSAPADARLPMVQGFAAATLNPSAGLFFIALFPQFLADRADSLWLGLALVAMHVGFAAGWFTLLGRLAARGGERVQRAGQRRLLQAGGITLMGFGYLFAWNA